MKFADNIKYIRKENNLSQETLAEQLGVSRQAVSKWESGDAYPEMEKMIKICELYHYNINDLVNDNLKEVSKNKDSNKNFFKIINSFLNFIYDFFDMFIHMTFKQKVKFILELLLVTFGMTIVFMIIGSLAKNVINDIIYFADYKLKSYIIYVLESLYLIVEIVIIVYILIRIIDTRYFKYFKNEVKKVDDKDDNMKEVKENLQKITKQEENKSEKLERQPDKKVIIRDPSNSYNSFLNVLTNIVVFFIKIFLALFGLGFIASFITGFAMLIVSFLIIKTGLTFVGLFLGSLAIIVFSFVILYVIYNFIVNRNSAKKFVGILIITSFALVGIGIGFVSISLPSYNVVDYDQTINFTDDVFKYNYNDKICIHYDEVVYTTDNEIKVSVNHPDYVDVIEHNNIGYEDTTIKLYLYFYEPNFNNELKTIVKGINEKKIYKFNYDSNSKVTLYAKKDKVDAITSNCQKIYSTY